MFGVMLSVKNPIHDKLCTLRKIISVYSLSILAVISLWKKISRCVCTTHTAM